MSMNLYFLIFSLVSQSGCKSTNLFLISKTFCEKFFKIFFRLKNQYLSELFRTAKVRTFIFTNQTFFKKNIKYFLVRLKQYFSELAGANISPLQTQIQIN